MINSLSPMVQPGCEIAIKEECLNLRILDPRSSILDQNLKFQVTLGMIGNNDTCLA